MPENEIFVYGYMGDAQFENLVNLTMQLESVKPGDTAMAKKVAFVLPGVSRIFISREFAARRFFNMSTLDFQDKKAVRPYDEKNRYMCLFRIKLDGENCLPMSVEKALMGEKLSVQCHSANEEQAYRAKFLAAGLM